MENVIESSLDVFDVELVPFDEHRKFDFADLLKDKGDVWDKIVESNGLYKKKWKKLHASMKLSSL